MEHNNPPEELPEKRQPEQLSDEELQRLVQLALEHDDDKKEEKHRHYTPAELWKSFAGVMKQVAVSANRERKETVIAAKILKRYILGKDLSKEELKFLKEQSIDLARILPIVAAQAVPAPVPITPFLIALGKKIGLDLVPKEQKVPDSMKEKRQLPPPADAEALGSE
jgi:hypothetical protein